MSARRDGVEEADRGRETVSVTVCPCRLHGLGRQAHVHTACGLMDYGDALTFSVQICCNSAFH